MRYKFYIHYRKTLYSQAIRRGIRLSVNIRHGFKLKDYNHYPQKSNFNAAAEQIAAECLFQECTYA